MAYGSAYVYTELPHDELLAMAKECPNGSHVESALWAVQNLPCRPLKIQLPRRPISELYDLMATGKIPRFTSDDITLASSFGRVCLNWCLFRHCRAFVDAVPPHFPRTEYADVSAFISVTQDGLKIRNSH